MCLPLNMLLTHPDGKDVHIPFGSSLRMLQPPRQAELERVLPKPRTGCSPIIQNGQDAA